MDNAKIGKLIFNLRKNAKLTQNQLAQKLNISDKAVSKWERGLGCPDISILPVIAKIFEIDLESLLKGELENRDVLGGNMKKLKFFVCPNCKNVVTSMSETNITCCGKKIKSLEVQKSTENHQLKIEKIENEFFITTEHPMTREHFISFVALLAGDTLILKKLYPEWDLQIRLPILPYGKLFYFCSQDGLFLQNV